MFLECLVEGEGEHVVLHALGLELRAQDFEVVHGKFLALLDASRLQAHLRGPIDEYDAYLFPIALRHRLP